MSVFEITMLVCFGAAWPFSIYKSWKTKRIEGKSEMFLYIVEIGYIAGIIHKVIYNYDMVIYLYILNAIMVLIDIWLYRKNKTLLQKSSAA
jgi:hypothetical protein